MALIDNHPRKIAAGTGALAAGLALAIPAIMAHEGVRTHAYIPVPGDRATICYGETAGVKIGDTRTIPQCISMLTDDVKPRVAQMQKCLKVDVSPLTAKAMIDFGYSGGVGAFCKNVASNFNAGHPVTGCRWMLRYVYVGKTYYPGLKRRRDEEAADCVKGLT